VGDDVGAVTSPPYDVIDEETVDRLHACHPYNVVRLILPRRFAHAPTYDGVSTLLAEWRRRKVLVEDDDPALYVYEYDDGDRRVRGLVGALGLRDRHAGVVLPHEEVMPGPVADRAELIRRTHTNLEPILLTYDGGGAASDLADAVTSSDPLLHTTAPDGSTHTVWRVAGTHDVRAIADDLAPRRALIADGHHRYAAYQQAQAHAPRGQHDRGGHDYGLAMLVDQQRYPLHLGPIHRVVRGIDLHTAARDAATREFGTDRAAARRAADNAEPGQASFACTDGERWLVLTARRGTAEIDTHVLHDRLLPAWGATEPQVRYVHDADHAVQEARNHDAVAVLVRPPTVAEVVAAAERGRSLPRKSTSFGPKPRMGLLMRTLQV
jgi:uncharacterized protein (DUF1015 family)